MLTFYFLIGLPGSGKSTYSEKLAQNENAKIFSSDAIREEIYGSADDQSHNNDVFELLHKRIKTCLLNNVSAIYDATNIRAKRRKGFLQQISKIKCKKVAIFFATPFEECVKRNALRSRKVPEPIIKKMYFNFNPPSLQEGFDELRVVYPEGFQFSPVKQKIEEYVFLSHDNPHHQETIGDHMLQAESYYLKNFFPTIKSKFNDRDLELLRLAILLHDIGKSKTKVFTDIYGNKSEIAHYYFHANVGAYDVFFLDLPEEFKFEIALLINYHMHFYDSWGKSTTADTKAINFLGLRIFEMLKILHSCDKNSH